jgi:hypothetical protein
MTDVASEISELAQELMEEGLNEAQAYMQAAGLLDELKEYAANWDAEVLSVRLWPKEKGEIAV